MTNFFHRFAEWQNYVHYFLLALVLSLVLGLQDFIILFIVLLVADSVIHFAFWFVPEPVRWKD